MTRHTTYLLVAALCLLIAAPALATQTRINSLSANAPGNIGSLSADERTEKGFTIRDQANIYYLPQFMVAYGNQVDVDATVGSSYGRMNVRYSLTDDAVLLLFGVRSPWAPVVTKGALGGLNADPGSAGTKPVGGVNVQGISAMTQSSYAGSGLEPTNHQFGLGFGMKVGESSRLGAMMSIGGKNRTRDANLANSNTWLQFQFGFGFDIGETDSLDFGLGFGIGMFTNVESSDRYVSDGITTFGLMAKGEFSVHQIASIVPYLTLDFDNRGVVHNPMPACAPPGSDPTTASQGCSALKGSIGMQDIRVGADLAIKPAEGVLVQPGMGLRFRGAFAQGNTTAVPNQQMATAEESQWIEPYYGFAAEAAVFDWMMLRLGARQHIISKNNASTADNSGKQPGDALDSNERHWSDVTNAVSTGIGIQLRGWTLDFNVTPTHFNNGISAISGTSTPFAVDFAMVYDW